MALTESDLHHVLTLAKLTVSENEQKLYLSQLKTILTHTEHLKRVDTHGLNDSIPPWLDHTPYLAPDNGVPVSHVVEPSQLAPQWEANGFRVPRILAEE